MLIVGAVGGVTKRPESGKNQEQDMAIDPMLYKKYNNRKTELDVGGTLAQGASRQAERDAMPKGVGGGIKTSLVSGRLGWGAQMLTWFMTFGKRNPKR